MFDVLSIMIKNEKHQVSNRVQRKLILQLALWASCNQHLPARKSFLLAQKKFFTVHRNLLGIYM